MSLIGLNGSKIFQNKRVALVNKSLGFCGTWIYKNFNFFSLHLCKYSVTMNSPVPIVKAVYSSSCFNLNLIKELIKRVGLVGAAHNMNALSTF